MLLFNWRFCLCYHAYEKSFDGQPLSADYVRTAMAKGVSFKNAIREACLEKLIRATCHKCGSSNYTFCDRIISNRKPFLISMGLDCLASIQ